MGYPIRLSGTSVINCPDGAILNVTVRKESEPFGKGRAIYIDFIAGDTKHGTWFAINDYAEDLELQASVAKILHAAKTSPEFRSSLIKSDPVVVEDSSLNQLLERLEIPGLIDRFGNLNSVPVHFEIGTSIIFPGGIPAELQKAAKRAQWLSVRKDGSAARLSVHGEHGNAHIYNERFKAFLLAFSEGRLTPRDYKYLGLPSDSTLVSTKGISRVPVAIDPVDLKGKIESLAILPVEDAHEGLLKLKSGRDSWSSLKLDALSSEISNKADLGTITQAFRQPSHQATALRWHLRGLPAAHAICKTRLDIERKLEHANFSR